jgi:hypothetical protein
MMYVCLCADFAGKDRQGKTIVFITAAYIKVPI